MAAATRQRLPASVRDYAREQHRRTVVATLEVQRQWRRVGLDLDAGWLLIRPTVAAILDAEQRAAIAAAERFIPAVIEDTGQSAILGGRPEYRLNRGRLVGLAGDGRPTITLARQAVTAGATVLADGGTIHQARHAGAMFLERAIPTLLADTRRTVEKVGMASRGVTTWVRGLNAPSCGRCIVLAGKPERTSTAFLRHPGCDCVSIPASEALPDDAMVNPTAYLDELSDAELARALGSQANAQAWRDGADPAKLINAYRRTGSVRPAQSLGGLRLVTTEGTSRRGRGRAVLVTDADGLTFRARLMPQSIYQIATDQDDAIRLLRLYGWIV